MRLKVVIQLRSLKEWPAGIMQEGRVLEAEAPRCYQKTQSSLGEDSELRLVIRTLAAPLVSTKIYNSYPPPPPFAKNHAKRVIFASSGVIAKELSWGRVDRRQWELQARKAVNSRRDDSELAGSRRTHSVAISRTQEGLPNEIYFTII